MDASEKKHWWKVIGKGLKQDITRRFPYYWQDFMDGLSGENTLCKVVSTTIFLYFAVLLPVIACGVINAIFTCGKIGVYQIIVSQIIGGLAWTFLSGQPLVIISNTMEVAFYNKIIHDLAQHMEIDFYALYACTGLWSSFFLVVYAISNLSNVMKKLKRSITEIYLTFVVAAFVRSTVANIENDLQEHTREETLVSILLTILTTWIALKVTQIKTSVFFSEQTRDLISSYALPIAILSICLVAHFVPQDMNLATFEYDANQTLRFQSMDFTQVQPVTFLISAGLGFCLSLVYLLNQSVGTATVDCPENNLKKGSAYHWDLLVLALINGTLGILGLSFVHALAITSMLQVKGLADMDESMIVQVRETRIVDLLLHVFIAISLVFLPYVLPYCPIASLSGLLLYLGYECWNSLHLTQRIKLLITQKSAIPTHLKTVPSYVLNSFTLLQIVQVIVLCFFGFAPWSQVRMFFPLVAFLFFFLRLKILPQIFKKEHLDILD